MCYRLSKETIESIHKSVFVQEIVLREETIECINNKGICVCARDRPTTRLYKAYA